MASNSKPNVANGRQGIVSENCEHSKYTYAPMEEAPARGEITADGLRNLGLGIGPDMICHRIQNGSNRVAYGEGNKMIQLANETFGYNGWSTTLREFRVDHCEVDDNNRVNMGACALVRVTLRDGSHREDVGYGSCMNVNGRSAAFEKVRKESMTDGIKRALRQFGWLFMSAYDANYMEQVTKRFKATRPAITFDDMYHGKSEITNKNAVKLNKNPQKPQELQKAPQPPRQPPQPAQSIQPAPQPAQRIPSSPPQVEDFPAPPPPPEPLAHERDMISHSVHEDLLASEDFDALDAEVEKWAQEKRTTNPINESNEHQLLNFVTASQAEQRQNLENAERFNPNTPDHFKFKKSVPIKRSGNIAVTATEERERAKSPLSAALPIETSSSSKQGPPAFAQRHVAAAANANANAVPSTPLVAKKRPLQDRGTSAINTPTNEEAKRSRLSQD